MENSNHISKWCHVNSKSINSSKLSNFPFQRDPTLNLTFNVASQACTLESLFENLQQIYLVLIQEKIFTLGN